MLTIDQRKIAGPATGAPFADGKSAVRRILSRCKRRARQEQGAENETKPDHGCHSGGP